MQAQKTDILFSEKSGSIMGPTHLLFEVSRSHFPGGFCDRHAKLTTQLNLLSRLRINGAIFLLPVYVVRAWIQKALLFTENTARKKISRRQMHRQVEKQVLVQQESATVWEINRSAPFSMFHLPCINMIQNI